MKDVAKVDQDFRMDGKNMSVVLSPLKTVKKPTTKSKVSISKDIPKVTAPIAENKEILDKN
jgi:hypothetical protein